MTAGLLAEVPGNPARSVNQNSPLLGIPPDSNRSDYAPPIVGLTVRTVRVPIRTAETNAQQLRICPSPLYLYSTSALFTLQADGKERQTVRFEGEEPRNRLEMRARSERQRYVRHCSGTDGHVVRDQSLRGKRCSRYFVIGVRKTGPEASALTRRRRSAVVDPFPSGRHPGGPKR
jgi:hypothetical protein